MALVVAHDEGDVARAARVVAHEPGDVDAGDRVRRHGPGRGLGPVAAVDQARGRVVQAGRLSLGERRRGQDVVATFRAPSPP